MRFTLKPRGLEPSLKRLYGNLSDAAHVRVPTMLRDTTRWSEPLDDVPGPVAATRYFPMFDRELARRSFALHVYLTLRLLEVLSEDLSRSASVFIQSGH